jgi:predicted kinase
MTSKSFVTVEQGTSNSSSPLVSGAAARQRHVLSELAQLVLFRGLPGAGKTTMAQVLKAIGYKHFEADTYFVVNGKYEYDKSKLWEAHEMCKMNTQQALLLGERVVVSNTFTRLVHIHPYLKMGAESIQIVEATGKWQSVHDISRERVGGMASQWETLSPSLIGITPPLSAR